MSIPGSRGTLKVDLLGAHRCRSPRDTIRELEPFLREFGVTRVADVTGLDRLGVPAVLVMRPNARSVGVAPGIGLDLDSARAAGLMESAEHFHAEHVDHALKFGSFAELARTHRIVDVGRLPRSVRAFDAHRAILWVEADRLGGVDRAWVPHELVHLNLTLPLPPGTGFFPLTSNGLAAGNTLAEAIVQATFELVERDALALLQRLPREVKRERRVSLDGVDDPTSLELILRYRRAGLRVAVWDATSDVGVAAFRAVLVDDEAARLERGAAHASGSGCHNDRGVALRRALAEAAQSRLVQLTSPRGGATLHELEASPDGVELEPTSPARRFDDVPHAPFPSVEQDLDWVQTRLEAAGLDEIWVVDLSRPNLPIAVVRAIVPGLEGSAATSGYVPGARAQAAGGAA